MNLPKHLLPADLPQVGGLPRQHLLRGDQELREGPAHHLLPRHRHLPVLPTQEVYRLLQPCAEVWRGACNGSAACCQRVNACCAQTCLPASRVVLTMAAPMLCRAQLY
jgi:hypothetical protein